jgi:hypothetical protein
LNVIIYHRYVVKTTKISTSNVSFILTLKQVVYILVINMLEVFLAYITFSEPCFVIHILEKDQQDAPLSHDTIVLAAIDPIEALELLYAKCTEITS